MVNHAFGASRLRYWAGGVCVPAAEVHEGAGTAGGAHCVGGRLQQLVQTRHCHGVSLFDDERAQIARAAVQRVAPMRDGETGVLLLWILVSWRR